MHCTGRLERFFMGCRICGLCILQAVRPCLPATNHMAVPRLFVYWVEFIDDCARQRLPLGCATECLWLRKVRAGWIMHFKNRSVIAFMGLLERGLRGV